MWKKCERGIWLVNWDKGIIVSPPCGLKSCPECAKKRRKLLALRIIKATSDVWLSHDAWFYTITPRPDAIYGGYSAKLMADGWAKLRKRLARRYPHRLYWACVREMSKGAGEFTDAPPFVHMHIIVLIPCDYAPILTEKLSEISTELGIGWKCLVGTKENPDRPLRGTREAYYVAKYATKSDVALQIPRAISFSQNFPDLGDEGGSGEGWEILYSDDSSIERIAEYHDCQVKNLHLVKGFIDHKSGL